VGWNVKKNNGMLDGMLRKINLTNFIYGLYIVSIFAFENATFSHIFSVSQIIFIIISFIVLIKTNKILLNYYSIINIALLIMTIIIDLFVRRVDFEFNTIYLVSLNFVKIFLLLQLSDKRRINVFINTLIIGGVFISLLITFEFIFANIDNTSFVYASNYRLGAFIAGDNVNITSMYLSISIGAVTFQFFGRHRKPKELLGLGFMAIFFSFALILTGTRKSLIYLFVVIFLQIFLVNKKLILYILPIIIVVYFALISIPILNFYIGHKINIFSPSGIELYSVSDQHRLFLFESGIDIFIKNPFGIGFGNAKRLLEVYTHNNFLEILVSVGPLGFVLYYSLYIYPIYKISKSYKLYDDYKVFFLSTLIAIMSIEFTQITYLYKIPVLILAVSSAYVIFGKKNTNSLRTIE
jgi:O-antigen ligase